MDIKLGIPWLIGNYSLPNDGLALTISDTNPKRELSFESDGYFDQYPIKCFSCLLHFRFRNASKKVEMNKKDETAIAATQPKSKYRCPKCNLNITQVHVGVMDQTGDIKCILFDGATSEMIGHSAFDLLDGVYPDDVGKVWPGIDIVMIEDADDLERASNRSHLILDTKRCSNSKKICLKPIKLEKLNGKNDEEIGNKEDEEKTGVNNEANENTNFNY
uniref:Replication factor A C-terminal domain-containing protein n=1 Tax=Arabidopsis thaliana TaxID=3702 RepID=Q9LIJ7_ARATH|nr:unnamed protein product [Arabidopsis thaliana]